MSGRGTLPPRRWFSLRRRWRHQQQKPLACRLRRQNRKFLQIQPCHLRKRRRRHTYRKWRYRPLPLATQRRHCLYRRKRNPVPLLRSIRTALWSTPKPNALPICVRSAKVDLTRCHRRCPDIRPAFPSCPIQDPPSRWWNSTSRQREPPFRVSNIKGVTRTVTVNRRRWAPGRYIRPNLQCLPKCRIRHVPNGRRRSSATNWARIWWAICCRPIPGFTHYSAYRIRPKRPHASAPKAY